MFDQKFLALNNFQIENGELLRILPPPSPDTYVVVPSSTVPKDASIYNASIPLLQSLQVDNTFVMGQLTEMKSEVEELKNEFKFLVTELKDFKADLKGMKEFLVQFTSGKSSTTHFSMDTEQGLEDLANVAAKDGHRSK